MRVPRSTLKNPRIFVLGLVTCIYALPVHGDDPLVALSDEFNNPSTLTNWKLVSDVEGWNANQLQIWTIDSSRKGRMVMIPRASSWYQNWRGVMAFKNVTGNFVVTTSAECTNIAGNGAPSSTYSLGGIMVRTPRAITSPADWTAGGENYVFLSLGAAGNAGVFQFEVKTTTNSNSVLQYENTNGISRSLIQVARIGEYLIMLRQLEGGNWSIHRRYHRADMPATLQVGLTTYTDWDTASSYDPFVHNQTVIMGGNPDLLAAFEYVRYRTPQVPAELGGVDLTNTSLVSDAALLAFLGMNANAPSSELESWRESTFAQPAIDSARLDADYDGDGASNLMEFFCGTNPLMANPIPILAQTNSGQMLFQFPRRRDFSGTSAMLQTASDLTGPWSNASLNYTVVDDTPATWQGLQAELSVPESGALFARLQVVTE